MKLGVIYILLATLMFLGLADNAECEYPAIPLPEMGKYHRFAYTDNEDIGIWQFPVLPGTNDWHDIGQLARTESMVMPASVLQSISTEGLVWTCIKCPYRSMWIASNSHILPVDDEDCYSVLFNGFKELLCREDFGVELLRVYIEWVNKLSNPDYFSHDKHAFLRDLSTMEAWLASDIIQNQLPRSDRVSLLQTAYDRLQGDIAPIYGKASILALCLRITMSLDKERAVEKVIEKVRLFHERPHHRIDGEVVEEVRVMTMECLTEYTGANND